MTVQTSWVTIPVAAAEAVAATQMPAWWARPAAADQPLRGAVLVLPEVFGVNGWVRSVAERLAEQGYAALAISTFSRTAPDLEADYNDAGLSVGREHRDQVTAAQLLADAAAAAAWLQQAHGVSRLGCVGFCFGGHLALLAATLPAVAATCDFYGARVSTFRPGGGPPSLDLLPQIPGRVLFCCGDADPLMPAEELTAIAAAIAALPVGGHQLLIAAGAGHGYMCEARADFHEKAAAAGWTAMLQLFGEAL